MTSSDGREAGGWRMPERWPAVLLFTTVTVAVCTLLLPIGFRGMDDYQYLEAALRWMDEGLHVGANHWANRLPYVWSWVGAFSLFGVNETAIRILHALAFIAMATLTWAIGRRAFDDAHTAFFGLLAVLFTPILFRLPSFYYPEAIEMTALVACIYIVLFRDRWQDNVQLRALFLAGLVGSIAVLVRQTAVSIPIGLAITMVFVEQRKPFTARIRDVAILAAGFILPLLAEFAYYWWLTGDWLHRFTVDSSHAKISSELMLDGVYAEHDNALFNWKLAEEWRRQGVIETHWSITPLVRLLTSPGVLLLPWVAAVGGWLAVKAGGRARQFALFVLIAFCVQYVINTFVLVVAPNTRYYGVLLLLMGPLAGYALVRMLPAKAALAVIALLFIAPTLASAVIQPSPAGVANSIARGVGDREEIIHLPDGPSRVTALRRLSDQTFANGVSLETTPVGGLVAITALNPDPGFPLECADGTPSTTIVDQIAPFAPASSILRGLGLEGLLPKNLRAKLSRGTDQVSILRRIC